MPALVPVNNADALIAATLRGKIRHLQSEYIGDGRLFCSKCGGDRRVKIYIHHVISMRAPNIVDSAAPKVIQTLREALSPTFFTFLCTQCEAQYPAALWAGPAGLEVTILPTTFGGLTTGNTPSEVAYYLDQAHRCVSVGARSAALAMYRSAVEMMLHQHGFHKGMLGAKLADLAKAKNEGKAPKWAQRLDQEYLDVLAKLGNGAVHPNDGDITKQAAADDVLLREVEAAMVEIIHEVYEYEAAKAERLSRLKGAATVMK